MWERIFVMVHQRKQREFDPTVATLTETVADPAFAGAPQSRESAFAKHTLMRDLSGWTNDMLNLAPTILVKLMRLGSRCNDFL